MHPRFQRPENDGHWRRIAVTKAVQIELFGV
jgi:hypothetical protein